MDPKDFPQPGFAIGLAVIAIEVIPWAPARPACFDHETQGFHPSDLDGGEHRSAGPARLHRPLVAFEPGTLISIFGKDRRQRPVGLELGQGGVDLGKQGRIGFAYAKGVGRDDPRQV